MTEDLLLHFRQEFLFQIDIVWFCLYLRHDLTKKPRLISEYSDLLASAL